MRLRRVPVLYWILAFGLAATTSLTVFRLAAAADARARYWGTLAEVPVAQRSIGAGEAIEPGDFRMRSIPESLLPESGVVFEPIGLTVIVPLVPGEVIVEAKLAPAGLEGPVAMLGAGQRAVAVARTEATPPLAVGDRVDVILTLDASDSGIGARAPAFPVARAAQVLDINETAVAIAVSASDAPKVVFGAAQGAISLAVAPPEDWNSSGEDPLGPGAGDSYYQGSGDDAIHDEGSETAVADEAQQAPNGSEAGDAGRAHSHREGGSEAGGQPAASE